MALRAAAIRWSSVRTKCSALPTPPRHRGRTVSARPAPPHRRVGPGAGPRSQGTQAAPERAETCRYAARCRNRLSVRTQGLWLCGPGPKTWPDCPFRALPSEKGSSTAAGGRCAAVGWTAERLSLSAKVPRRYTGARGFCCDRAAKRALQSAAVVEYGDVDPPLRFCCVSRNASDCIRRLSHRARRPV